MILFVTMIEQQREEITWLESCVEISGKVPVLPFDPLLPGFRFPKKSPLLSSFYELHGALRQSAKFALTGFFRVLCVDQLTPLALPKPRK